MKSFDSPPTECQILALSIFLEEDERLYADFSLRAVFEAMRTDEADYRERLLALYR